MNKQLRYRAYYNAIKDWLLNNEATDTVLFALSEASTIPYGILLTDRSKKTNNGKPMYLQLKGNKIPVINKAYKAVNELVTNKVLSLDENGKTYTFIRDDIVYRTIRATREFVNTTDGRWALPQFSVDEMLLDSEYNVKFGTSLNIGFNYSGIDFRIIQGIFIFTVNNVKYITAGVDETLCTLNSIGIDYDDKEFIRTFNIDKGIKDEDIDTKVDYAKFAEQSSETESLTESAKQEVESIIDKKHQEEQELLEQRRRNLQYEYIEASEFTDIPLVLNKVKAYKALDILDSSHTLYITGMSRSGKTYLTKYVAGKFIGISTDDIDQKAIDSEGSIVCYENLLWLNCTIDKKYFREVFAKFCVHNNSAEKCLVVFNEASKNAFMNLVPFWEQMDCDGKSFKDFTKQGLYFTYNDMQIQVPRNLRIIANIANSEYDSQMENRFGNRLDLDDISTSTENIKEISEYTGIPENIIEIIVKTQNTLLKEWKDPKNKQAFFIPYHLKYNPYKTLTSYKEKVNLIYAGDISTSDVATLENYIESIKPKDIDNED